MRATARLASRLVVASVTAMAALVTVSSPAHADTVHIGGSATIDIGAGHQAIPLAVAAYGDDGQAHLLAYQRTQLSADLVPGSYDIRFDFMELGSAMQSDYWLHDVNFSEDVAPDYVFQAVQHTLHLVDPDGQSFAADQVDNFCSRPLGFTPRGDTSTAQENVGTTGPGTGPDYTIWMPPVDADASSWTCTTYAYVEGMQYTGTLAVSDDAVQTVVLSKAVPPPSDPDGVPDDVEAHAPNGGDGNGDGTPDSQQPYVASLPTNGAAYSDGVPYVTIASPSGSSLSNVSTTDPASLPPLPAGETLPAGLASFVLSGVAPGSDQVVSVFPGSMSGVTGYAKYDAQHGWTLLPSDRVSLAVDHVEIRLTDGGVGDADGVADGVITDPGGVAKVVPTDSTPPTVTGTAATKPNANGWYSGNVKVHWTATDPSGVVAQPADTTVTTEGANVTATSRQVCDKVAPTPNCGTGQLTGLKIDKTAPSLAVTGVVNGATYTLGAGPVVGCSATDALSGLAGACKGAKIGGTSAGVGGFGYAAAVGDKAGNSRAVAAAWNVVYGFGGFAAPLNDPAVTPGTPTSIFKAGTTVPVAFGLKKADGTVATPASKPVWVSPVKGAKTTAAVNETVSNASGTSGSAFVWRNNRWEFNWSTKGLSAGYLYKLGVKLDDGTTHYVNVGLR